MSEIEMIGGVVAVWGINIVMIFVIIYMLAKERIKFLQERGSGE